mmetsp:Transcript_151212/g.263549  ORF Transcript_151212/g.263549 Transcript_151212/m.263549 type:complete len:531 (-) Transcript_151212:198-1790(-)
MANRPLGSLAAAALRDAGRPDMWRSGRRPSPLIDDADQCPTPAVSVPPTPSPTGSSAAAWRASLAAQCLGPAHLLATQPMIEAPRSDIHHALPRGRVEAIASGRLIDDSFPGQATTSKTAWPAAFATPPPPPALPPPMLPPQLSSGVFHEAPPPPQHSATDEPMSFSGRPGATRISIDPFADQVASMLSAYAAATPAPGSARPSSPLPSAHGHPGCVAPLDNTTGQQDNLIVKNTFFDVPRSPSLERVCRERQVHSCPGSRLASPRSRWPGLSPGKEQEPTPSLPSSTASTVDTTDAASSLEDVDSRLLHGTWGSNPRGLLLDPMPLPQVEPIIEHGERDFDGFEAAATGRQILDLRALMSQIRGPVYNNVGSECCPEPFMEVPPTTHKRVLQLEAALPVSGSNFMQPPAAAPPALPGRAPPAAPVQAPKQAGSVVPATDVSSAELGSAQLPSIGSLGHHLRRCKPCAFANKAGCTNGAECTFCHLCKTGEKKRRRKEKRALLGAMKCLTLAVKSDAAVLNLAQSGELAL